MELPKCFGDLAIPTKMGFEVVCKSASTCQFVEDCKQAEVELRKLKKGEEQIKCPKCGASGLYDFDYDGDMVTLNCFQSEPYCKNCGCHFVARGALTHISYEIIDGGERS